MEMSWNEGRIKLDFGLKNCSTKYRGLNSISETKEISEMSEVSVRRFVSTYVLHCTSVQCFFRCFANNQYC